MTPSLHEVSDSVRFQKRRVNPFVRKMCARTPSPNTYQVLREGTTIGSLHIARAGFPAANSCVANVVLANAKPFKVMAEGVDLEHLLNLTGRVL